MRALIDDYLDRDAAIAWGLAEGQRIGYRQAAVDYLDGSPEFAEVVDAEVDRRYALGAENRAEAHATGPRWAAALEVAA